MSEVTKQLRALVILDEVGSNNPLGRDAADRIDALEAENKALREGLREAEAALELLILRQASRTITGTRVSASEQYPWIAKAMGAQARARSLLAKGDGK